MENTKIDDAAISFSKEDAAYMQRCFELARLGLGSVSPNPMVGAVLVHEGKIIGAGWHQQYGAAHAEVNALESVPEQYQALIPHSTLYCSLEPCFHHGKTPPCVDLILRHRIPRLAVCNTDPNPQVAGQSLQKLRAAGVEIIEGVLKEQGQQLNRTFFTWISQKRPYIILKWAQSSDGIIAKKGEQTPISGPLAKRLVHRWRSEADAILVGTTTALVDNPRLDNRLYFGSAPLRIALDFNGRIPATAYLLDDQSPTWIIGPQQKGNWQQTRFLASPPIPQGQKRLNWIPGLLQQLYEANQAILLVEGGSQVHQQFLDVGLWDEIRIIENPRLLGEGVLAPSIPGLGAAVLTASYTIAKDRVQVLQRAL